MVKPSPTWACCPGSAITINVPLVFWDAGRIIITTDGADLLGTGGNGNPFLYRDQSTQVTYYGSVSGNTLTFTPVYNSFAFNSANNDYEPSTASWQPPTDLTSGMNVNGPGIPANTTITVGSDPHSVTLNPPLGTSITTPAGVQQFTFTSTTPIAPIAPIYPAGLHHHGRVFQRQQRRGHVVPLPDGREPQQ